MHLSRNPERLSNTREFKLNMKSDQPVRTLPRKWKTTRADNGTPEPMVNPEMLSLLHSQGITLDDIKIDILKLKACESKKLYSLGILNLEQLSNTSESALRVVPHFGVLKVRRLKAKLNSHLVSLLSGISPLPEIQNVMQNGKPPMVLNREYDPELSSIVEFIAELEAASESLEKLRRRIRQYVEDIRKNQRQ
jgi:hypothetical protein